MEQKVQRSRSNGLRVALIVLFVLAEAVLYAWFLYRDIAGTKSGTPIKYAAIVLVFCYTLTNLASRDGKMVAAALLFTVAADSFLLLIDRYYLAGVLFFCVVQVLYLARMACLGRYRRWEASAAFRLTLWLAVSAAVAVAGLGEPLLYASAFYFVNLFVSAIEAFGLIGRGKRFWLFAIGLVLFVCCDICVGLNNASQFLASLELRGLEELIQVGMWAFYLPSQVMIALSVTGRKKTEVPLET